jgi:hypothetical protein
MKTMFSMTPWTQVDQTHIPLHTHHMGACAPCEAMRRQKEANEEFKKRYGLIDLNRARVAPESEVE